MEYSFCRDPYAISVCRIEPENNTYLILEAFSRQDELPLAMVGNWKNSGYGLSLFQRYGGFPHIYLFEPIYEAEKINCLRSRAAIYIHGHSAGGTNPSLVEAMFLGLPVFAFDCVYNRHTTENQCVYWSNVDELYNKITLYNELRLDSIGKNMKVIAENRYRWNTIVAKYEALFR
jgi:glycosyltransferase involved in cell wall biosynthesis